MAGGASIRLSLGLTAQLKGDWDYAQEYFEQAAQAFDDLGDLHGFSLAQNNLGNLHSDRGDICKAILCYNLSLDAKRAQNDPHGMATTLVNLAAAYFQERELERQRNCTFRVIRSSEKTATRKVRDSRSSAWPGSRPRKGIYYKR